jgi:hypothetical protein
MIKDYSSRLRRSFSQMGKPRIEQDIFFLHIPKCGGTSLVNSIRQHYLTLDPKDDRKIGHLHTGAALTAANMLGQDPLIYNRDILKYFLAQNFRFVSGHFAFSNLAYEAFNDHYAFITLLRDPVKKWFSLFFFNRYKEGDHYALELDLAEFLETEMAAGYGCDYAMQFAGDDSITNFTTSGAITQFTTDEAINRAISNLKNFHLVGVLEKLPEFAKEFQALYKVKLEIPRMRKSPVSDSFKEKVVTPEILAQVKELNKPNIAIYEYVINNLITNN